MRVELDLGRATAGLDRLMLARLDTIGRASLARALVHVPRDTGALAAALDYEVLPGEWAVRFGVLPDLVPPRPDALDDPLVYGPMVERGTPRMPPRSFIRRSADELAEDYRRIAARGR